jgi:hypothetical protein
MSSNRLIYDKNIYEIDINESTKPLNYYLFKYKYETKKCALADYTNNINFDDRADTESKLYGLFNNTKDETKKNYVPPKLSPQIICQGIYYITPNNIVKSNDPMIKKIDTSLE